MTTSLGLQTIGRLWGGRLPGQLIIQMTDACNARCPQCGMRVTENFKRSRLPLSAIRRILDAAASKGIQAVSFTGGEPLLYLEDLVEMMRHAGQAGIPYIRTGTNGFVFMGSDKKGFRARVERIAHALAETPVRNFWISIDSAVPAVHEAMRGLPGVIEGIRQALPIFHACGIYPSANLGINRNLTGRDAAVNRPAEPEAFLHHYRAGFDRFYRFVRDLGFTMVNCCYPMSISDDGATDGLSPVYAATATDDVVHFSPVEKKLLFQALLETIPDHRSCIRIFTPRTSLLALIRQMSNGPKNASHACRGGIDFFFIDAKTGHVYPCGYRGGEDMGEFEDLDPRLGALPEAHCRQCDWECFRDPSELLGPVLDLRSRPIETVRRLSADRTYTRLWLEDLRYYHVCGFFDGRKAPDWERLNAYAAS